MTKAQKAVIIAAIIFFLLTLVFPLCYPRSSSSRRERGFHFLFDIPASEAIDVWALSLSWMLLASLAGIAYYLARPNSELSRFTSGVRQFTDSQAFGRCIRSFCFLSIVVVLILITIMAAAYIETNYLEPKREAERARRSEAAKHIELVYVPAGSFTMGSPSTEKGRDNDEQQHPVRISKGFYIGATEVTQAQWIAILGSDTSSFNGDDLKPVAVSWEKADEFCRKLSQRKGRKYRLPTEAEWEYACRAGTKTAYSFGDTAAQAKDYAWFSDKSDPPPRPVGQKRPNPWGLHDMHGNEYEWCSDWYDENYYSSSPSTDPQGPSEGSSHVCRGGNCYSSPEDCRSASRHDSQPPFSNLTMLAGFRVVSPGF